MVRHPEPDPSRGVYGISVAAALVGNQPQNLRLYEARGLLTPARSENDLERLRDIGHLLGAGLNLAAVDMVLELQAINAHLQDADHPRGYDRTGAGNVPGWAT